MLIVMQRRNVAIGKQLNKRDSKLAIDVGTGVAGAGAYIDGKFSFFPAGTNVWKTPYHILQSSYHEMANFLQRFMEIDSYVPQIPSEKTILEYFFELSEKWKLKEYPSIYMEIAKRFHFLNALIDAVCLNATILCEMQVIDIAQMGKQSYSTTPR